MQGRTPDLSPRSTEQSGMLALRWLPAALSHVDSPRRRRNRNHASDPDAGVEKAARQLTLAEQLVNAHSQAQHCLNGGARQSHQNGEDLWWLAGWADNMIEEELIREKQYQEFLESKRVAAVPRGMASPPKLGSHL